MPDDPEAGGRQEGGAALDLLATDGRLETRMLKSDQEITEQDQARLRSELEAYRDATKVNGRPVTLAELAKRIGTSPSVLTEWQRGKYGGDNDRVARQVDEFISHEQEAGKKPDLRATQRTSLVEKLLGAAKQAIVRRSIGVITGEPGIGKSVFARYLADQYEGGVLITCDSADADMKAVIDGLHTALKLGTYAAHARNRKREVEAYLQTHLNTIIIIDEAQFLSPAGLEIVRCLHDKSDPAGRRNVPVLLFGDSRFYKIILSSRSGGRSPLSPQITSRLYPVVNIESECTERDEGGRIIPDSIIRREDIELIVKQHRLRLVRPDALDLAVRIANLSGWGRLRLAVRVLEIALDIKRGPVVTREDLYAALGLFIGPSDARLVSEQIGYTERPARKAAAG